MKHIRLTKLQKKAEHIRNEEDFLVNEVVRFVHFESSVMLHVVRFHDSGPTTINC